MADGGSPGGKGSELETSVWIHIYLNIHTNGHIYTGYSTHIYFLVLSAERAWRQ